MNLTKRPLASSFPVSLTNESSHARRNSNAKPFLREFASRIDLTSILFSAQLEDTDRSSGNTRKRRTAS